MPYRYFVFQFSFFHIKLKQRKARQKLGSVSDLKIIPSFVQFWSIFPKKNRVNFLILSIFLFCGGLSLITSSIGGGGGGGRAMLTHWWQGDGWRKITKKWRNICMAPYLPLSAIISEWFLIFKTGTEISLKLYIKIAEIFICCYLGTHRDFVIGF